MPFGNVHVGTSTIKTYLISNQSGFGSSLRGAIQTSANGGNVTDPRLSGSGVTASNFGLLAPATNTSSLDVTFNATSAGALSGQQVRILNNFDNLGDPMLEITGSAYRYANPTAHTPEPVDFGIVHVGDVIQQSLSITNNVPNDGFSERLSASLGSPTGDASTNGGLFSALLPGSTDNTSLVVGVNTATAGAKAGTATISLTSIGAGTSGLPDTSLASQTVNVQAQVNNYAVADVVKLSGDGTFMMTGVDEFTLDLGSIVEGQGSLTAELGVANMAATPADDLAGSFTLAAADFLLNGFDAFAGVAAGSTRGGQMVELPSLMAGEFSGLITLQTQSTNPQPFSMNLPPITIHVTAKVRLPGDFNGDGTADTADYVVWRKNDGTQAGYDTWRANFGRMAGGGSAAAGASRSEFLVPEPYSCLLSLVAMMIAVRGRGLRGHATQRRWPQGMRIT
jgi:hypothetical protein